MTAFKDWSITASANTGAAVDGFFRENMAYSEVNDAARAMQAILARDLKDKNGTLLSTGATSSYNLSVNTSLTAYTDGDFFRFKAHAKNAGATVVKVSTLSARPVVKTSLAALTEGDIVAGGIYEVFYNSASANFQLLNPTQAQADPRTPAEITASVTPTDYRYEPGNVLRYGAVADGATDCSTAFNAAAAVIGTYNTVVPPGSYMMTSQWLVTAPAYNRASIFAYGAEILTTGAISALAVTGGSTTGGLTVLGLQVNHRGNADATCGFDLYGAWNVRLQDCSVEADDTGAAYAGYRLRNTTAADTSTGTFWTLIDHCHIRRRAGGDGTNPAIGVLVQGAANATTIRDCNLTGITAVHHTHESGQEYVANGLLLMGNAFEGYTTAYHWDGPSSGTAAPGGMRAIGNRFEDGTTIFSFTGAGSLVAVAPPFLFGNYRISNAGTYLNNPDGLAINRFDPSETPDGALAIYNDSPFLYRNSGTASEDHAALFQSVTGKGIALQAVVDGPEPGTDVVSLSLRAGGGASLAGASNSSLYQTGVGGISWSTTEAKNLRGTVTLSGGTAAVTFGTAETNASYYIATGCSAAEAISVSSKATTGFTVTSSNGSSTAVVDWVLIR